MYDFIKMTNTQLTSIFRNRLAADIEVSADITKFKEEIPNVDFSKPREVPPSPAIINAEGLAHAVVYTGNHLEGDFTLFQLLVAHNNGKIHFTELPNGNYKAAISWKNCGS